MFYVCKFTNDEAINCERTQLSNLSLFSEACDRCVLLVLLITAVGGTWFLENPSSTKILRHDRFRWLLRVLHGNVSCHDHLGASI